MDVLSVTVLAILVFGVAFITANLGLGGGILYVPTLLSPLWTGDQSIAAPISLSLVMVTGIASTLNHARKGLVDPRLVALLVPAAAAGALLGVAFNLAIPKQIFLAMFIVVIVAAGIRMLQDWAGSRDMARRDDDSKLTRGREVASGSAGAASGFLSSSLGVGGGLTNVPILVYGLGRSPRKAIGTSSAVIVPTALVGLSAYLRAGTLGPPDFVLIAILAPLVFVGAFVGSRWGLARLRDRSVELAFIIVVFLSAASFVYELVLSL